MDGRLKTMIEEGCFEIITKDCHLDEIDMVVSDTLQGGPAPIHNVIDHYLGA